jgi:hypothetical protein
VRRYLCRAQRNMKEVIGDAERELVYNQLGQKPRMSDRRRHNEELAGISDHKRALIISADKRVRMRVRASAIQEEGGGE